MPQLVPCVLERRVLPKVWGGRALERVPGLTLPGAEAIGETWEVYDRPDGSSGLRGTSTTLRDLMEQAPRDLLGACVEPTPDGYFPLLIKYIDARSALSVQVHPDDEAAKAEGDWGKTEAWVVLEAGPEARIIRGFKPGVTEAQFRAVAHTAEVEGLLWAFRPAVGDTVLVPPGTVHAIGPDVVVYEVQQNSDVTYRLWDWGRPRETHVAKALGVTTVDPPAAATTSMQKPVLVPEPIDAHSSWLVRTPRFRLRRYRLEESLPLPVEDSVKVLSVVSGHCALGWARGWQSGEAHTPLTLHPGDTALVPACAGEVFANPLGAVELLWADAGGS